MDGGTITCRGCKQQRDPQEFWDRRTNLGVCGWCRGENNASYWPTPFSVLDKMPELPAWKSENQCERYSETVLVYTGSTLKDGTVSHFRWEMARLTQIQRPVAGNGLYWQQVYSESDWTHLWEVSHWMPLPTPPTGSENYEVPGFLKPAMQEHLDFHKQREAQ